MDRKPEQSAQSLPVTELMEIERVCCQFEAAWKAGHQPKVEDYLADSAEPRRNELRRELEAIDAEYRRRAKAAPSLAEFVQRLPGAPDILPATEDYPPGRALGRYVIARGLGHGSFGTVYMARDSQLDREVAIKVPRREHFSSSLAGDRFFAEAQMAAKLRHLAIVSVYDVGYASDGRPFVVMEYVEGQSLSQRLATERVSHCQAAELVGQAAEAAHYAHKRGFVHRDLKPANILLDREGRLRIADFGLAVHESDQPQLAGQQAGSLPYMAPEQVRGEAHRLDGRADIWALGAMLYEMLTGRRPFEGETREALSDEILHRDPKPPRQIDDTIPPELERITLKCLAKQPGDRYATAGDLARDLRRWQHPPRRRIWAIAAMVAVVFLALALSLAAMFGPRRQVDRPGPPARAPLAGTLDVLIWGHEGASRRGLGLREPGAAPVQAGDRIRIEARLNRPAHVYLFWIDTEGHVWPVYPWVPGRWGQRAAADVPTEQLSLPSTADEGWPMKPSAAGMETLVLLARETPLPGDVDLPGLLTGLPLQRTQNPRSVVWFAEGKVITKGMDAERSPDFFDPEAIGDPVLSTQRLIQERLGPYFVLHRAVSFANQGQ